MNNECAKLLQCQPLTEVEGAKDKLLVSCFCCRLGTTETCSDLFLSLNRAAQITISRLKMGHHKLLSHLHRLKISHSYECPCNIGPQTQTSSYSPAHFWHSETLDMTQSGGCPQKVTRDQWRCCGGLWTYWPDWKPSMTWNAEEQEDLLRLNAVKTNFLFPLFAPDGTTAETCSA